MDYSSSPQAWGQESELTLVSPNEVRQPRYQLRLAVASTIARPKPPDDEDVQDLPIDDCFRIIWPLSAPSTSSLRTGV